MKYRLIDTLIRFRLTESSLRESKRFVAPRRRGRQRVKSLRSCLFLAMRSHHVLQQQEQPADNPDIGEKTILHAGALHRIVHLPEAQQEQRSEHRKYDQTQCANGRIPVDKQQNTTDRVQPHADPERGTWKGWFKKG